MNQAHNMPATGNRRQERGFTLIELTLAMAFIALLLLAIAMLTLQIGSIYNKGLALRSVNESGQLISSDIQRTLNAARPSNTLFVEDVQRTGGRLCSNNIVYAWNYGKSLKDVDEGAPVTLFNRYEDSSEKIRLIRFIGPDTYCEQTGGVYPTLNSTGITNISNLLGSGENNLTVTKFSISRDSDGAIGQPVEYDSGQRLYQITIAIGTDDTDVIQGNSCQNTGTRIDNEYCAMNEFNFTARAGAEGE